VSGRWAPRPIAGFEDGTVLFDGVCVICSRFFRFVAARDPPCGACRAGPGRGTLG
jgi:hypothetical protein